MPGQELKYKPLVEAILELKWELSKELAKGLRMDPYSKLLPGRFYERVKDEYPCHEQLPASAVPDEMVGHVVQHRFRVSPDGWPVLQLGPGVLTVNETEGYDWEDFRKRCEGAVVKLVDAYPAQDEMNAQEVVLRYIDAVDFNFSGDDVLKFLRDKMKTVLSLPDELFCDTPLVPTPSASNWQVSYPLRDPQGVLTLRFGTGHRNGTESLIWETLVTSKGAHVPKIPDLFLEWLDKAHAVTHDCFFKLIAGDLERRFAGEQDTDN